MRAILLIFCLIVSIGAMAQSNVETYRLYNGNLLIEGYDALGGLVRVEYNENHQKVAQDRIMDNERIYAYFSDGQVTRSGIDVYSKPEERVIYIDNSDSPK